jgi:hypothetical protein
MNLVLNSYFQKSFWMLYPLLNIPKTVGYKPLNTYIKDVYLNISEHDYKLLLCYKHYRDEETFKSFESIYLLNNIFYKNSYQTNDYNIYIFDISYYKDDYDLFLQGKYSKLSKKVKEIINSYFSKSSSTKILYHPKINAYLYPNKNVYKQIAEEIGETYETISSIKEVLNKPNLEKETLKIKIEDVIES